VSTPQLTIGKVARAAGVGVETVRYYQRRRLIAVPRATAGAFRRYSNDDVDRLRFIKRAQEVGFSLDEIAELLKLNDGKERAVVRKVAASRLEEIHHKIDDLERIARALEGLIEACANTGEVQPCPIIEAFGAPQSRRLEVSRSSGRRRHCSAALGATSARVNAGLHIAEFFAACGARLTHFGAGFADVSVKLRA